MDVRDYEYIVAIAEQGSISRAAACLYITQSALTRFLQRKEQETGLALFLRQGNQLVLTDAGRRYVETGRRILELDRTLTEHLERELSRRKGQILLGFPMGWTGLILEDVLPPFRKQYPDVMLCLKEDTSQQQLEALLQGERDLVLAASLEQTPGLVFEPVCTSRMVLAVPENSPLLDRAAREDGCPFPVTDRSALSGIPFISLSPATNSGALARELLSRWHLTPAVTMEMSNVRSAMSAVELGYGVSLVMSVPGGGRHVRYLCLRDTAVPEETVWLVRRQDRELSAPMRCLLECLRQACQQFHHVMDP